jgi:hypothetical protein
MVKIRGMTSSERTQAVFALYDTVREFGKY